MVLASYMIVLTYLGVSASNHFEWDNYHWGEHHHQGPWSHPVSNEYYHQSPDQYQQNQQIPDHYQQDEQNQGHFEQGQQNQGHYQHQVQQGGDSHQAVQPDDQFQGYPTHSPSQPLSTMQPSFATVLPTTQIAPVPNSVPKDMPKHRILLRQLYQQVLGPNFTSPGVQQLAFLSSAPSLPLNSHVQAYPQPQPAETQYDLPQYIEPPPPPHIRDQFNYYS